MVLGVGSSTPGATQGNTTDVMGDKEHNGSFEGHTKALDSACGSWSSFRGGAGPRDEWGACKGFGETVGGNNSIVPTTFAETSG
jgi:hypothetical protein